MECQPRGKIHRIKTFFFLCEERKTLTSHTHSYQKIKRSCNSGREAEALVPSCWLCSGMYCMFRCHGHSAFSLLIFWSICFAELGIAAALAAWWQTARSQAVLQYHSHKCAHKYTLITHTEHWNMFTGTITHCGSLAHWCTGMRTHSDVHTHWPPNALRLYFLY